MSSEGPYGRQGFQANPSGYGGDAGQTYAAPQYGGGQGYGGGQSYGEGYAAPSYAAAPSSGGAVYGADYGYGAQIPGSYEVRKRKGKRHVHWLRLDDRLRVT
jgi:hypothetical protein